ncbi:MAG: cytochrome b N-terminal domain-containing protein [Gemmatimonadetes bacterium]|nr:cytochrome b N-terminal domain-containing protein [Gemmatimonadota bacterium]
MRRVLNWIRRIRDDLAASTDASLLAVPRFLGLLYGPIDHRLPINEALRKALRYRLPAHVTWRHALGGIVYLLFILLVVTGVLLAVYYRPSTQEAYPSVQRIVTDVSFGWLVRDVHVWAASLIVVAALAHMARVFADGVYKPPRETNWLVGVLLLFLLLAFGATGYVLPWDQWAYWTIAELLDAVAVLPVIGPPLARVLTGDVIVSGATLSRHFALHVIVLPWLAFWLLALHFALLRKHGVTPPITPSDRDKPGLPFFPHHLLRSFIVAVLAVAITVSAAAVFPRPVGHAANPYAVPDSLVSTWVPVEVSLGLVRYLTPWGLAAFTALGVALALLPLFDRDPARPLRQRPVAAALGLAFLLGFAGAWVAGRTVRTPSTRMRPASDVLEQRTPRRTEPGAPLPEVGPTPERPAAPAPEAARPPRGVP